MKGSRLSVMSRCLHAVGFADVRLQRNGRCHESEVFAAFRRELPRYRAPEAVTDEQLRSFVRNWAAGATRSSTGYLKGVSVSARAFPPCTWCHFPAREA